MTEKTSKAKKKGALCVHTVTSDAGDVIAKISLRHSQLGHKNFDYIPLRVWRNENTGRQQEANPITAEVEEQMVEVTRKASAWIRSETNKPQGAISSNN